MATGKRLHTGETAQQTTSRRSFMRVGAASILTATGVGAAGAATARASSTSSSYTIRAGTDEETTVYVREGSSSGPTVLVVGGIHGNEDSGWLSAHEISKWKIDAGKLIVLPEANVPAIEAYHRPWGTWDLNRHFPAGDRPLSVLAQAIWDDVVLRHDPDFVWDLHSSRGIYALDEGVGQAVFPTRAGDARDHGQRIRNYLNSEFVPDSMPDYKFTGTASPDGSQPMLKHKVAADHGIPAIIFEVVYNDLPLATQVAWTTAAVKEFLRNYGLITRSQRTITISGRGSLAHYSFTTSGIVTKSAAYGASINAFDTIDGATVTGRTTSEPDSFDFTGDIVDFEADGDVDVTIDGEPMNLGSASETDVISIVGDGDLARYRFIVDGSVEKSTAYGGTINDYDTIDGNEVWGRTTNEPDSFAYTGDIVDFHVDGNAIVTINGEEVDPATLGGSVITINGDDSLAYYEFTVDGTVEKSTAYGGTLNDFDEITGTTVTGRTTSEPDSFVYTGDIVDFTADGNVSVLINGEPVVPALVGASIVTIVGKGSLAHYAFTVTGDVEKSTAHGGTINAFDQINDSVVTGRTTSEPDSFAVDGFVTSFEADAPVDVLADGSAVDL